MNLWNTTGFTIGKITIGKVLTAGLLTWSSWVWAEETRFRVDIPAEHQLVCRGREAGGYAAFPDICRTRSGDLLCVFYAGYGHVSTPTAEWAHGGRIMVVRSQDQGATWSAPQVVADTLHDDRDPHIALMQDGSLICNWFVAANPQIPLPTGRRHAMYLSRSNDNGSTWQEPTEIVVPGDTLFVCSAPIRELNERLWILGLYTEDNAANRAYGATIRSSDRGKTWTDLALIGHQSPHYLDAETDVVELRDGTLLAALRSSRTDLYWSTSADQGQSWSDVRSSGFPGHSPHFLRHSTGPLLLTHRLPHTALHISRDEGATWDGPHQIDTVIGAYPSCVELDDRSVYCVYYEEGEGSGIRGKRLRIASFQP